jgi:hypothetical protein
VPVAGKVKTWVWVVVAVVVLGILGIIAMAGVGIYFFSHHINTRTETPAAASRDFDQVSARFSGEKPLIELDEHGRYLRSNTDRHAAPGAKTPEALHVLAFDPDDGRIVRVEIPFWLLRLKLRGSAIDFNGQRMQLEDMKLTVEDLQRYGPALVVDHRVASGQRVLVWSQ